MDPKMKNITANILNLPGEILHMIFDFLDYEELKIVNLVCKDWKALIMNYSGFLKRTRTLIDGAKIYETDLTVAKKRSYQDVVVKNMSRENCRISKIFILIILPNWKNLSKIELDDCHVNGTLLIMFFHEHPKLKDIKMSEVNISNTIYCKPVGLRLTNLTLENRNYSTDWIFDHLHGSEVTNYLRIDSDYIEGFHVNPDRWKTHSVLNFLIKLKGHTKCLHLDLDDINVGYSIRQLNSNFQFTWEILKIDIFNPLYALLRWKRIKLGNKFSMLKRLCLSSSEISTLMLPNLVDESEAIDALYVMRFCSKVNCLVIENLLAYFDEKSDFRSILKSRKFKMKSIENLNLRCSNFEHRNDETEMHALFFSMFPNVTTLTLEFRYISDLNLLSLEIVGLNLKSLRHLELTFLHPKSKLPDSNAIKFPELETVTLCPLGLYAKSVKKTAHFMFDLVKHNKKLKTISFIHDNDELDRQKCDSFLENIAGFVRNSCVENIKLSRWRNAGCNAKESITIASKLNCMN